MAKRVKVEGPLDAAALNVLRRIPGVAAARAKQGRLTVGDATKRIAVEVKRYVNAATAGTVAQQMERHRQPVLLVAARTTAEARDILVRRGVNFVDGQGNAHIDLPAVFLHVQGKDEAARLPEPGEGVPRLAGKAGVAVQAVLLDAQRAWRVHDLANAAAVSIGQAHKVLRRLEREGLMTVEGTGPRRVRRLANPGGLLDLWAEESTDRGVRRTPAFLLEPTPRQVLRTLSGKLDRARIRHALTGAAGASLVAPFVTAVPVTEVWVAATAAPEQLLDAVEADPVADGQNVVFLQAKDDSPLVFERLVKDAWVANPLRLYLDLRRDPRRGREQADHLREEVIGF